MKLEFDLDQKDVLYCLNWGEKVSRQKENYPSTKNYRKNTHGFGKIAELVVNRGIFKSFLDWNIYKKGDNLDFRIFGKTFDVKATERYIKPWLIENIQVKKIPDYYILVSINLDQLKAKIEGFISSVYFLKPENIMNWPSHGGKRYVLKTKDLHSSEKDWEILLRHNLDEALELEK